MRSPSPPNVLHSSHSMDETAMRMRYMTAFGRHRPRCAGRCLVAEVDEENNAVTASVCLILVPTLVFMLLVPMRDFLGLTLVIVTLLLISLFSLCLAMYTEPGILPIEQIRSSESQRRRVTHVLVDGARHELSAFRAKMCRQTENCVEEFDHYCPWVGNAVGRRNYRYFVAFILTVSFLAFVVAASVCLRLLDLKFDQKRAEHIEAIIPSDYAQIMLFVLFIYTLIVLCSVCGLTCFHFRLIAINQTTNENIRGTYFANKNPHDKGTCIANFISFASRPIPRSKVISNITGPAHHQALVPQDVLGLDTHRHFDYSSQESSGSDDDYHGEERKKNHATNFVPKGGTIEMV